MIGRQMTIGCIDYLNCYPFYHHMLAQKPLKGVHVKPGLPEDLNCLVKQGVLDLSPISAAAYPPLREQIVLLPWFCLSSVGYVGSVILASKVPIEQLHGKRVGISRASKTSEILLKILLEKHYGLVPQYCTSPPRPALDDTEAALIIGNDAMVSLGRPVSYIYDIGDLWLQKTGRPVVFAVFAVQKKAVEKQGRMLLEVIDSFSNSLSLMADEKQAVIKAAAEKYPDIDYDISAYYDLLQFDFTPELKAALGFYFHEAADHGLMEPVGALGFLDQNLEITQYRLEHDKEGTDDKPRTVRIPGR